ncbi:iron-sulfur cluster repair di-iron protein [Clostridium sp.]|uniref:iron-sulfur cluster repair di-iron protein n=1 Tax=Clostridium sp. TaxID=1506 RepID=UPI0026210CC5|nr:iron-sulfur cluster repair di-iron protein [Clostridium sp.]
MKNNINRSLSLGECVVIYPAIVERFNDMELDYCCGGSEKLESALNKKQIDIDKFIGEINKEFEDFKFDNSSYVDWNERSSEELIDHIVNTHHAKTFQLLKEIDPLLVKVFKVHFYHSTEVLTKVHNLFGKLKCELEEHLIKEERILFPNIIDFEKTEDKEDREELRKKIKDFIGEHEAAGDILKELAEITDDYNIPEWACTSFKLVYTKLHDLEKDLFVHIHKENNILFKRY